MLVFIMIIYSTEEVLCCEELGFAPLCAQCITHASAVPNHYALLNEQTASSHYPEPQYYVTSRASFHTFIRCFGGACNLKFSSHNLNV